MISEIEHGDGDPNVLKILQIQNSIKAYVYLICWFLSDFCKIKKEPKLAQKNSKRKNPRGGKDQSGKLHSQIQNTMVECMTMLNHFLKIGLHFFWQDQKIED